MKTIGFVIGVVVATVIFQNIYFGAFNHAEWSAFWAPLVSLTESETFYISTAAIIVGGVVGTIVGGKLSSLLGWTD